MPLVKSVAMSVSGINWYQVDQAWNQSRASISQQFLDSSSLLNSALTNAMSNQISGTATLAAQAALKRIQGKTAAATVSTGSTATSASSTASAVQSSAAAKSLASTAGKSGSSLSASPYRY